MKASTVHSPGILGKFATHLIPLLALCCLPGAAVSAARITQTLAIHQGWNSIHLEVTPDSALPEDVFAQTPIEIAATHLPESNPVYFPSNPVDHPWQKEGWLVWYAPNRPDSFAATLNAISGGRSYLVYSLQNFQWNVEGEAVYKAVSWKADAYTLTGLPVDPAIPPTFQGFFDASDSHRDQPCFRLENGRWALVRDPAATRPQRGEAYWIFSRGASDYQGPLQVRFLGRDRGLNLRAKSPEVRLNLRNLSKDPIHISLACDETLGRVPLAYKAFLAASGGHLYPDLPRTYVLPELASSERSFLWLRLKENALTRPVTATLLHVTDGRGTRFSFPLTAYQSE